MNVASVDGNFLVSVFSVLRKEYVVYSNAWVYGLPRQQCGGGHSTFRA